MTVNFFRRILSKSDVSGTPGDSAPLSEYGAVWKDHPGGLEWYEEIYRGREDQHRVFQEWAKALQYSEKITSVCEFGCGLGVGYADFFRTVRYMGLDISEKNISWCREHRANPLHEYLTCDFITDPPGEKFDLVFSQATIDNTYDMDAFLQSAANTAGGWLFITAYRGYFPELSEHRYTYSDEHKCYYNDIAPAQARLTLEACGCTDIAILPSFTGRADIPFETLVLARTGRETGDGK